jgi:hypothetical protein
MYPLLKTTFWICSLYVAAYSLVFFAVNPIQFAIFPKLPHLVSLFFIPNGVGVFATILFGYRAIPGVFFGAVFSTFSLSGIDNSFLLISISTVSAMTAPIVFYALSSIGINAYYLALEEKLPKRENLLLAGLLTSVLSGFSIGTILEQLTGLRAVSLAMVGLIVGNFVGFLAVVLLAKLTAVMVEYKNR